MTEITLQAKTRQVPTPEINQGREAGNIPAVLYGEKQEAKSLYLAEGEFNKIYKQAGESSLIDLVIDGGESVKVLVQEAQKDPVSDKVIHVDFIIINMNKEMQTRVPVVFFGESKAVKDMGGTLVTSLDEIEISCLPKDLISEIKVDISAIVDFDSVIRVSDLNVPETIKVLDDPERTVATATPVKVMEESEPEAAESEEGEEKPAETSDDKKDEGKGEEAPAGEKKE